MKKLLVLFFCLSNVLLAQYVEKIEEVGTLPSNPIVLHKYVYQGNVYVFADGVWNILCSQANGTYAVSSFGGGGSSPIIVRRTADTSNSATTLVNLGSMRLNVLANKDYYFEFYVIFSSAATTTGIKFAVTCPASPVNIQTIAETPIANNSASSMGHYFAQASGTTLTGTGVGTINVNYIAKVYGILRNGNNAGAIQLQIASEVAASAISVKTGSWGTITQLN